MKQCTTCQHTNYHNTTNHSWLFPWLELLQSCNIHAATFDSLLYYQDSELLVHLNLLSLLQELILIKSDGTVFTGLQRNDKWS